MQSTSNSAFFFDFDGVLVDSLETKTSAYEQIFKSHGAAVVAEVVSYHQHNAGISRVDKIDHAHTHILDTPYSKEEVSKHIMEYSNLVFEKVVKAAYVPGAMAFVKQHYQQTPLFIISGTPEDELREIVKRRKMQHYFREILGSPTRKPGHIRSLVERYNLKVENCFFMGDALTDYHAARETGMPFIGIEGEVEFPENTMVLPDCTGLEEAMTRQRLGD